MKRIKIILLIVFFSAGIAFAEQTNTGTTVGNFLEIGIGAAGTAMGNAYTAMCQDPTSLYWNPAGLAFVKKNSFYLMNMPYLADIQVNYLSMGIPVPNVGVFGMDLTSLSMNDMKVTTLADQEGTGQSFTASNLAFSIGFARHITDWFSFGFNGKFIREKIYLMDAHALALNMGVNINTYFFSPTGNREDGMTIAMSISNFGTKMELGGLNTLLPADINPDEDGNNEKIKSFLGTDSWSLPLYYRLGLAFHPVVTARSRFSFAVDAVHPNNSNEFLNLGTEFSNYINPMFQLVLRLGYANLFKKDSEQGLTFGGGFKVLSSKMKVHFDYSYSDYNRLGYVHRYCFSFFL